MKNKNYGKPSEPHLKSGKFIEDIVLGGQDGLVNVLGLILGIAVATANVKIVILAGVATAFAESISMLAVAYTSKKAAIEYYEKERQREINEIENLPEKEKQEIREIFRARGFNEEDTETLVNLYSKNKKAWLDLMMVDELRLLIDEDRNPLQSSLIVGFSALLASFIPLAPFFFFDASTGIIASLIVSTFVLFIAGAIKSRFTAVSWKKSAIELTLIGMIAAITGYAIGLFFNATNFI